MSEITRDDFSVDPLDDGSFIVITPELEVYRVDGIEEVEALIESGLQDWADAEPTYEDPGYEDDYSEDSFPTFEPPKNIGKHYRQQFKDRNNRGWK